MAAQDVYDFEVIIPTAVATILEALDLDAYTIADTIDFQKKRPRVEVVYHHHGDTNPKRMAKLPDGTYRSSAFRGELRLFAISAADETGKLEHSRYRSMVRNAIAALEPSVNETQLPLHKIQFVQTGQEETGVRQADGYQQTTFSITVDISMQQDAWRQI
jgi:hypothetical protein